MSRGLLADIPAAFAAHPRWNTGGNQIGVPRLSTESGYLLTAVALVCTTSSPYMQFFMQASVAEKGIHGGDYIYEQLDVYSGTIFAVLIASFVIIATGATLFLNHHPVQTAIDAAFALKASGSNGPRHFSISSCCSSWESAMAAR